MSCVFNLRQLAEYLDAEWSGDENATINSIASLDKASDKDLSFLSNKKFASHLSETKAKIVIVRIDQAVPAGLNVLKVKDPYLAYAKVSQLFCSRYKVQSGIHPSAEIDATAKIAESARIGPKCVIGPYAIIGENTELQAGVIIGANVSLGDDCVIFPNVVIYDQCVLGNRVRIHACTVIGSDGFGFAPSPQGWTKIYQLGCVRIGDDVEIGASTTIDRGAIDDTVIENGVIIDNQVHIAHNCRIGKNTAIAGCVGIAGSTVIGSNCTMGGLVAISGHLNIADNVHFNGSTVVTKSINKPGLYSSGTVVQEVHTWRKNAVRFGQLEQWVERIKHLEKSVGTSPVCHSDSDDKS